MNVKQTPKWLKAHGYDGLCCEGCGCGVDDLFPCGYQPEECVPAYKVENCKCGQYDEPHTCYRETT